MNPVGVLACCAVCNLETHRRCSRCLNIYYCDKQHQAEDWKRHKSECTPKLPKQTSKKDRKVAGEHTSREVRDINHHPEQSLHTATTNIPSEASQQKHNSKAKKKSAKEGSATTIDSKQTSQVSDKATNLNNCVEYTSAKTANTVNNLDTPSTSKDHSVISSVVCANKESTKQSAITYEGSSEQEILSESAQQLSTAGFMGRNRPAGELKTATSVESKMALMPGIGPELASRVGHREYPEAQMRMNYNSYIDNSDPCYEICEQVIRDMTTYGVCVLDNFLGKDRGLSVRKEVLEMHRSGIFTAGKLVSESCGIGARAVRVRSDRITWIDGREPQCHNIGMLINQVDSIILRANKMPNNGKMGDYNINTRTKAMVACYPGSGSNYVKHVDNPNRDGRCITAIYYLNLDWDTSRCGGLLRVFPEGTDQVADIEPVFDRMLFFWSDRRNPHEVQPAFDTRYAITLWYFDAQERDDALQLYKARSNKPATSK